MATIKENLIAFSSDRVYNQHISEVEPDSLAFIFKKGQEKLITQGSTFYFIPGNGSVGQVLKKRDGYFSWDDLYSVRVSNSVENLSSEYTYYILEMTNTKGEGSGTSVVFGDFTKGQTCTVYMTRDESSPYAPLILIDETKYISLNNQYEVKLEKVGEWVSMKFFSSGGNVYVEINDLGAEVDRVASIVNDAYLMKKGVENGTSKPTDSVMTNDTNIVKNQYEFVIGKHNDSRRESSGSFGIGNTLLAVGNGLNASNKHNALEILQSGEIFIPDLESEGEYYQKSRMSLQGKLGEIVESFKTRLDEIEESIQGRLGEIEDEIKALQERVALLEDANDQSDESETEGEETED